MNYTQPTIHLSSEQLHYLSANTPFYYCSRQNLLTWLPDTLLSLAAPLVAYWALCMVFHMFDTYNWKWLHKYRIHDSPEAQSRNLVSQTQVIVAVLFQQLVQTLLGLYWLEEAVAGDGVDHLGKMKRMEPFITRLLGWVVGEKSARGFLEMYGAQVLYTIYWWAIPTSKFLFGMFIIDSWQYFLHRAMHMNTFLYKKFHSVHHRLYVPYAFGALYNHPIEGLCLDTLGALLAEELARMTMREAMLLFVVSTLKTVDDHCGYKLPWDPLQFLCANNADYHDIHHQQIGIKSNFSQPFFVHWDAILGTRMTRQDIALRRTKKVKQSE